MFRTSIVLTCLFVLSACGTDAPPPRVSGADVHLRPDTTVVKGRVADNTTMDAILRGNGLDGAMVQDVVEAARRVFDPRKLRALQPFFLERTLEGALRLFEYEIDGDSFLRITRAHASASVEAEVLPIPKTLEYAAAAGGIDEATPSLFQSIDAAGETADLAVAMAEILSGEIDFNTELQPGDRYAATFERFRRDTGETSYGAVTAVRFENDGRVVHAIRFTPPGAKGGYYDEHGRSVRRFFLRSPLKFVPQVTSGFSSSRRHPVLHTSRAHRGVDYRAPTGAPVVAVANGRVVSATFDRTNGRMVRVRHSSGYESFYLHLSAFGPGIKSGVAVSQGDLLGRVGSTGLATGPHLHYGLQKNGVFVNPLREHRNLPPGEPVPAASMALFHAERDRALAALAVAADPRRTASTR